MTVVVFDVDDTLYDQFSPFELAMIKNFGEKKWLSEISLRTLYQLFRYHSDLAFPDTVSGALSLKDMRVYRIQAALNDLGIEESKGVCQAFQDCYFYEQNQLVLHPEMVRLLTILDEKKVLTGLLTNGPTEHQQLKIEQLGVSKWISEDTHHISESIGYSKPDVSAFKVVETIYPDNSQFLYIGDSYENDVIGAKKAGWQIVWLNKNNKRLTQEMIKPDVALSSYDNIVETVLGLLQEE